MKQLTSLDKVQIIQSSARGITLYKSKYVEHESKIPFYVSPDEHVLTPQQYLKFQELGEGISELFQAISAAQNSKTSAIFFRPDILLTTEGFKVCEIECSPFGFPLTIFLQDSYNHIRELQRLKTVPDIAIEHFAETWKKWTNSTTGTFLFSSHTDKFLGQYQYFASRLKTVGLSFSVKSIEPDEMKHLDKTQQYYRCFYLHEQELVLAAEKAGLKLFPKIPDVFESKESLVLATNDPNIRARVSPKHRQILDKYLLPTWILSDKKPPSNFPVKLNSFKEIKNFQGMNASSLSSELEIIQMHHGVTACNFFTKCQSLQLSNS